MDKLPTLSHITVVSTAQSASSESTPVSGDASDFSGLLARQISSKISTLEKSDTKDAGDEPATSAVSSDHKAAEEPDKAGLNVIAFLPLSALPVAPATIADGTKAEKIDIGLETHAAHNKLDPSFAPGRDGTRPENLATDAATEGDLPAKFAVSPQQLPAGIDARVSASDAKDALGQQLKVALRPQASGTVETPMPPPGLLTHAAVAARTDTPAQVQASQAAATPIDCHVGTANWGTELGQRVVWMTGQNQQVAHINVTPPQLGPIEIQLNITNDQASAVFVSPHAAVRDAVEAALPRLREMLADSGISLGNVDVSANSFGHSRQNQSEGDQRSRSFVPELGAVDAIAGQRAIGGVLSSQRGGEGLVDIFA